MKVITLLLVALLAVSAFAKFGFEKKVYLDFTSIIEHVNSVQKSWVAGHNEFFDGMDLQTIKGLMGTLETPEHLKLPLRDIEPLQDIPESFNSADAWPKCESIREIRDQSTCGSCWAFGAVESISDRICIASGQTKQTRISAADMLSCCGISCGNGCNGGYPSGAMNHWKSGGVVTGGLYNSTKWCYPYQFAPCDHHVNGTYGPCGSSKPTPKCEKQCVSGYNTSYSDDRHYASSVYSVPSQVAKIQTEILTHGPIEVAFTVYGDFPAYKSGVYHHVSGSALGGHAVKMVGWGVEDNTPYWLIANSWNEGWGDKGFFKIRRGNNECGIESQGVAGIPKL
jgi:cathepsin B